MISRVRLPRHWTLSVCISAACSALCLAAPSGFPLDGTWKFKLDPQDLGLNQRWYQQTFPDQIRLPGSLPEQGIGNEISTNTPWTGDIVDRSWFDAPEYEKYRHPPTVKVPFWLQPEKYYAGPAWYQKDIIVPQRWAGYSVFLILERPHWETRVWVDGEPKGSNLSLSTPHEYDLGSLKPGLHTLTVRVDNRLVIDVGRNSHSVSDHTQGNWNGIVGKIRLEPRPNVWIDHQRIFTEGDNTVRIEVCIHTKAPHKVAGTLATEVREKRSRTRLGRVKTAFECAPATRVGETNPILQQTNILVLRLERPAERWSEFSQALYEVTTELRSEPERQSHIAKDTFGFRDIATDGTQFIVNGRKTFVRGTLECCIFPKTGHPPTEIGEWRRLIRIAKAHGLNNLRFHSWCPPEAAFDAADELGMYLHVECASWANQSTTIGDGKPVDQWVYDEADRILRAYGNHPSFVFMLYGNEPGGRQHEAYLRKWVDHYKKVDPRRLYSGGAGWPQLPEDQFHVTPDPRIQAWGAGLKSRINALPPETRTDYRAYVAARKVPVISHEIGQWCVYPNFDEISKYTGYLKPRNFEIFRDRLAEHGMLDQAREFLLASGKLQALCYKEDIESALRTPGMGGFQLLDLHDFPGQGTALVGVLDPFWGEKGYITAREFSRFCGPTVLLARMDKRVFTQNEALEADIEAANFGPVPIHGAEVRWRLVHQNGSIARSGTLPYQIILTGNAIPLGHIRVDLQNAPAPARYKLVVDLHKTRPSNLKKTTGEIANDWDIWVYPAQVETTTPSSIKVTHEFTDEIARALEAGETVLWLLPPGRVRPDPKLGKVQLGFSSIFWNTAWTGRQPPHTLGILCKPEHPLFAEFPTEFHSNWQWWDLVTRSGAMILDQLPVELRPTVQVIDDWVTARKLGLLFEAKVGRGRLVVCSIDLERDLDTNPVARQFRHSLFNYMTSDRFAPKISATLSQVRSVAAPTD
jgi:hypothetical protein